MINTAESVTAWHPDKICDQISDAILDECLKQDPLSRVAVETMGGHGKIFLTGEITTKAVVNYEEVAQRVYKELMGKNIFVLSNIVSQCPEISQGVNKGGAGDQGCMIGYACRENELFIPQEMYLARELLKGFATDGKSQVTVINGKIDKVVLSVQGKDRDFLKEVVLKRLGEVKDVYCNNTGSFVTGGFDADSGVTGRKIVVDAYGPRVAVGGGAFSGKDATKVDRSAAYMARFMALSILNKYQADEVIVTLAYVIGGVDPVMKKAVMRKDQKFAVVSDLSSFDCRPQAIIERFDLRKPIYLDLARNGHFGRKELAWEVES